MKTFEAAVICLIFLTGCGLEGPIPSGPRREAPPPASQSSEQKPAAAEKAVPEKPAVAAANAGQQPGMVREKVTIASGEKGRGYGEGFLATPLKALWFSKAKLASDQLHHALDLYKASEGHAPKTQQEFDKIIAENHIQLPTLPAGSRYVYDPDKEELMLLKPKEP